MLDTKKMIAELSDNDIKTAEYILYLLEQLVYSRADADAFEKYIRYLQTIQADIRHIKELV